MIKTKGNWFETKDFLRKAKSFNIEDILDRYGKYGVDALSDASPKDTGLLSESWSYKIVKKDEKYVVEWHNSDIEGGCSVAILVQYGHGTKGGTYVQGIDFINPAIRPILDKLAFDIWEEVKALLIQKLFS